jgi:DNA-binding GntR family transcriptional regulator
VSMTADVTARAPWGMPPARETVGAAAYRLLRDGILLGHIPMGTRINEMELSTTWKVSRTPIRDALRRLEAEGLVQAIPGRGVIVPRISLGDADELYELREVLEARAARRAAERAPADLHARLSALIKAFGTALKQNDVDRLNAVDTDLHAAISAASGNGRLERSIDTLRAQVLQVRLRTMRQRGRPAKSFREMATLTAAIHSRNGARAEAAMREHLASLRADLPSVFQSADG